MRWAARAASATRVVFPRPASPLTRMISRPSPFATRVNAAASVAVSDLTTEHSDGGPDGQAWLQRDVPTGLGRDEGLPHHLDRVDGIGQPFQGHDADRPADVPVPPPRHQGDDGRGEDLTPLADCAQSGCFDHTIPVVVAVVVSGDLPAAQPDPQSDAVRPVAVVLLDALLHGDGTGQRGRSRGEDSHDPVAQSFDLVATGAGNGLAQDREIPATHLVRVFGRHGERQLGRSDHIREENCQVLSGHAAPPGAPRRTGPLSYDRTLRRVRCASNCG